MDIILWGMLLVLVIALVLHISLSRMDEGFVTMAGSVAGLSLTGMSNAALDSAPSTAEVKQHYKNLLLYANSDISQQGTKALRLLADFRDRVYGQRNFRSDLATENILSPWPSWLPPLDPTMTEPVPSMEDAITAEVKILAYLQKNYPQEENVDEQTGSTLRNIIDDFGRRFVFETGPVQLRPDFLSVPLLQNWRNPIVSG
jgi:hypothetical protein